jgi:hypothetical protein
MAHKRRFMFFYTAFKGTKFAQESAMHPVIEARDVGSALNKFKKGKFMNKTAVFRIEEVL